MQNDQPSTGEKKRWTRLAPEAREAMILDAAIDFFAENGFAAQTRELADRIGVSQGLIFRYFATKEMLVDCVYQKTFEARWDSRWDEMLLDRSVPIRDRLVGFFLSYINAIDDSVWIRIVMYSSLAGWDLARRYISEHVDKLMVVMSQEMAASLEMDVELDSELIWHLQSTFIYYLVRKHIHKTPVCEDKAAMVERLVDAYIYGIQASS